MKALAIIASVIMIVFPTVSLILGIVAAKRERHMNRTQLWLEITTEVIMWLATLGIFYLAGVFKNFGL